MNAPIGRLFGVIILLFTLLVVWTTRWTVVDSKALQNNTLNARTLIDQEKIDRGRILADDGQVLAKSVSAPGGTFTRTYPTGPLFSQAVGYSIVNEGEASGLELSAGNYLRGIQTGLSSIFGPLGGGTQVGDDVYTTLDPTAQKEAVTGLAGRVGSVVAINPQTGAVKAMYSNPTYNDNEPTTAGRCNNHCLVNLATEGLFPPGSTFKVVTTAAALDSGKYTPNSMINGKSPLTVSGIALENDNNENYGPVTLTKALTDSINTVFAQVGQDLGRATMETYMKRFGFYSIPPLDFPPGEMTASGERLGNKLLYPTSDKVDLGRMSIGQDKLLVTPLQMAMVAAAVANHGKLMVPHMVSKVVNQDGQVITTINPSLYGQVMSAASANAEAQMMTDVVEEGTGLAANVEGIKVAGKTGTASVPGPPGETLDDAWFIGFAPVNNPKVAVAVVLPSIEEGYGGTYAAPIAAQMIKTLLAEGQ